MPFNPPTFEGWCEVMESQKLPREATMLTLKSYHSASKISEAQYLLLRVLWERKDTKKLEDVLGHLVSPGSMSKARNDLRMNEDWKKYLDDLEQTSTREPKRRNIGLFFEARWAQMGIVPDLANGMGETSAIELTQSWSDRLERLADFEASGAEREKIRFDFTDPAFPRVMSATRFPALNYNENALQEANAGTVGLNRDTSDQSLNRDISDNSLPSGTSSFRPPNGSSDEDSSPSWSPQKSNLSPEAKALVRNKGWAFLEPSLQSMLSTQPSQPSLQPKSTPQTSNPAANKRNTADDEVIVHHALVTFVSLIMVVPNSLKFECMANAMKFTFKDFWVAKTDGYLRTINDDNGILAIFEVKAAARDTKCPSIQRQEAAEMAAWICDEEVRGVNGKDGYHRKLLIAQDYNEIWIVVGKYKDAYVDYIQAEVATAAMSDKASFMEMTECGPFKIGNANHMLDFAAFIIALCKIGPVKHVETVEQSLPLRTQQNRSGPGDGGGSARAGSSGRPTTGGSATSGDRTPKAPSLGRGGFGAGRKGGKH